MPRSAERGISAPPEVVYNTAIDPTRKAAWLPTGTDIIITTTTTTGEVFEVRLSCAGRPRPPVGDPVFRERLTRLRRAYAPHEHRPLGGYVAAMGSFGALAAAISAAVKVTGKELPERPSLGDVALVSVATHKLSRLISKDSVTSPLRAPFTRYTSPTGSAEVGEEVRDEGSPMRHSIGELISCPFCLAVWVATGLTGGLVLAPRTTRLAATALTAVAVSDFLQLAYSITKEAANEVPAPPSGDTQPAFAQIAAHPGPS